MLDVDVQVDGSELLLVVPLAGPPQDMGEPDSFSAVDADLELPPEFFATLRRFAVPGEFVVELGARSVWVRRASVVAVGDGDLEAWFAVLGFDPASTGIADWLDCARVLSKADVVADVCSAVGIEPLDAAARGTVLVSVLVDDPSSVADVADHLRTRAPSSELVVRLDASEGSPAGSLNGAVLRRVVTRRTCGFVIGGADSSAFFSKTLPRELDNQYMLAVVILHWQRRHLLTILEGAQQIWAQTDGGSRGVERSTSIRRRFDELTELRGRYARLVSSGTFGPVFESMTQARFWADLKDIYGVIDRYQEVSDALDTLGQSIETEAGLRLERLLAFFALVLGVPSLIFAVFGANIGDLTRSGAVSWVLVTVIFIVSLTVGAAAYIGAVGRNTARPAKRNRRGLR